MRRSRTAGLWLAAILPLFSGACGSDGGGPTDTGPVPAAIEIASQPDDTLTVSSTADLAVRVKAEDGTPVGGVAVQWSVTDGGGTIEAGSDRTGDDGVARATWTLGTGAGSQRASAAVQGINGVAFSVTAVAGEVAQVESLPDSLVFSAVGDTARVRARVTDAHGNGIADASVTFQSTDPAVATVSEDGLVESASNGSAQVVLTAGAASDTVTVTVEQVPATVTVIPARDTIALNGTVQLTAKAEDANGAVILDPDLTWSSSDTAVATVDATGLVMGRLEGEAVIVAQSAGVHGTASITVVAAPFSDWTTVGVGYQFSCGLTTEGKAYCWGADDRWQLGNAGVAQSDSVPHPVGGGLLFDTIAVAGLHTCGIAQDGAAYCWGTNSSGDLGNGEWTGGEELPTAVLGGLTFTSLTGGWASTCGLTPEGDAYCWGLSDYGILGNGDSRRGYYYTQPDTVLGGHRFSRIDTYAGGGHTCAITLASEVYCWGPGHAGRLGHGAETDVAVPTRISTDLQFVHVTAGDEHTCALTTAGEAYCWGANDKGQLGIGSTAGPDQCNDGWGGSISCALTPVKVSGGLTFVALEAGNRQTCGITAEGELYCWGAVANDLWPAASVPTRTWPEHSFRNVAAESEHLCGIVSTGVAYCWGEGGAGQLGHGGTADAIEAPAQVSSPRAQP